MSKKVIKSQFVSLSESKKEIQALAKNHPRILPTFNEKGTDEPVDVPAEDLPQDKGEAEETMKEEVDDFLNEARQEAQKQAQDIINQAQEEADQLRSEALAQGKAEAAAYLQEEKQTLDKEYESKKQALYKEVEAEKQKLQPDMIKIINDLVHKLIGVQKISEKTIGYLIRCGLDEVDLLGDLTIKVSGEDLDYVMENLPDLTHNLSDKMTVEVIKDKDLDKDQCLIETNMGTIDCSLDVQLDALSKELHLIYKSLDKE